jgi:hypothetical protein
MTVKCLNANEKLSIIQTYKAKLKTQQELADDFGVSRDTIYRVIKAAKSAAPVSKGPARDSKGRFIAKGDVTLVVGSPIPAPVKIEVKAPEPSFIWNANSKFISITQGRETWNADKDHPNFAAAFAFLSQSVGKSYAEEQELVRKARDTINIERAVKEFVKGDVRIADGTLYYQDIELRSGLVDRILDSMNKGENFEFYLPFLENLLENPSPKAVSRLFDFLVANDIELTEDGHFIGWKVVRSDYKDHHSGTFDNSPGQTVKMPRTRVNDNDEVTCSNGLHVCSKSYIKHFSCSTSRVVSVKVHPRDVVSIPVDYGDAKMRTCQYEVLEDVTEKFTSEIRGYSY